jgi:hypothetical protein
LSVGGALANQKGFGDFMPRKFDVMSAINDGYGIVYFVYVS